MMAFSSYKFIFTFYVLLLHITDIASSEYMPEFLEDMKREVWEQQDIANRVINFITNGPAKHQVYDRLAKFTDRFGSRIAGSKNLENAIDYMLNEMERDGLENVHGEEVNVTHWVRGSESAQMILPRNYSMSILGLGSSVGTPPEGITAEVLVVESFDELTQRASEVNQSYITYLTFDLYFTFLFFRSRKNDLFAG